VTELHQLTDQDHEQLCMESRFVARAMAEVFSADSMNVAKLGNVVSQLHLHHVVRYRGDAGWPGPVWGLGQRVPYEVPRREDMCNRLRRLFDYLQDPEQDEPPLTGS
jgi:diadenosine tetraphosphate (Ap4A) HIT family hydrolase